MEVVIRQHEQQCGVTAADIIADAVACGATTLGLATGSSPLSVYRELIRRHRKGGLTFADVQAFLLDEYVGLPPGHPQSYAHVIRAEFTDHVGIASDRVHSPDGIAEDIFGAAQAYDALITDAGPIDVQLLGIGANGHIGFNEPGSSLGSRTRVKTLTEQTRRDNARFSRASTRCPATSSPRASEPSAKQDISCSSRQAATRRRPSRRPSKVRSPQAAPHLSSSSIRTSRP